MLRAPTAGITALVEGAGDPAFAVDATRTIVAWNRAVERLLHLPAAEALGRSCAQVLGGRDARGRLVCGALCPATLAAQRREPLAAMELQVDRRNGAPVWLSVSSLIPTTGAPCIMHILRDVTEEHHRQAFVRQMLQGAIELTQGAADGNGDDPPPVILSPRQTTILRLLASGAGTRAIARTLSISPATVRNHIQQVMIALQAHSRLEAVVQAIQRRIL